MSQIFFYGTYSAKIDPKGRFTVPVSMRQSMTDCGSDMFLSPLHNGAIYLGGLSVLFNSAAEDQLEHIAPYIMPMPKIDEKAGRLLIPLQTRSLAGFGVDVTVKVTGHGQYFAIRTQENWEQMVQSSKRILNQTHKI